MTQPKPSSFSKQEQPPESDVSPHIAYRFEELSNEAKEVAIVQVHFSESKLPQNFDDSYDQVQIIMKELFTEAGLKVIDNIYWEYTNTAVLDLSDVCITTLFIKQHLTEEEYRILLELNEVTSQQLKNKLYDIEHNKHGFVFSLEELSSHHFMNNLGLAFLVERSTDEEVRVKYKLPYLFLEPDFLVEHLPNQEVRVKHKLPSLFLEADDTEELIDYDTLEDFEKDFNNLCTSYLDSFSQKISEPAEALAHTCISMINSLESYLGSKDYYKQQLESKTPLETLYRFDETGVILTRSNT